ncbi:hypothetical protein, partial [Saccharothrix sp. ST-888]|uniref:hypothetical protein n=1 Tax=Saccharothrix sp. ST-888 TaxID=1427391 RepID=UPI0005ED320E
HDWSHTEIDVTDARTAAAIQQAITAYAAGPHASAAGDVAGHTIRELGIVAGSTALRQGNPGLVTRILGGFCPGTALAGRSASGAAALSAVNVNYLGINNHDKRLKA